MFRVVYVSSAVEILSDDELDNILTVSRRNNGNADITGMLLYKDGNFMQLLEGSKPEIDKVLSRIEVDIRHRGIIKLLQEEVSERAFSDWSMGFKKIDSSNPVDVPGHNEFLSLPFTDDEFQKAPSKSMQLLLSFKKSMR